MRSSLFALGIFVSLAPLPGRVHDLPAGFPVEPGAAAGFGASRVGVERQPVTR